MPLDPDLAALQEVRDAVERASRAQAIAATWTQEKVDRVCASIAKAAASASHDLARLAVEETGIGRVHYKVLKNLFGSEGTWNSIKDERTVGILSRDEKAGVIEVGTPAGVIAVIIPTTNPTSTAMNNALISVKGRNAIVISPHPRARRCIAETVEVMRHAIERAGGPADLILCLSNPTIESTAALMKHRKVALILATGGSGLVRSAYSSGKPAYGVGPGNVPVYVDRSAKIEEAARWIVASQSFDNATLCCSEQALVLDRPIADRVVAELKGRGAHLCNDEERAKLEAYCVRNGMMSADVVGQDPWKVAKGAGFDVPRSTTVLLAYQEGVGREHPLSGEILCPLLSLHLVDGWEEGCKVSLAILNYGGLGHTIGLWAKDERVLEAWFLEKPANRIVVNGPTSMGAVGYSTGLMPAFSLGCGPQAGNITSDNISARHMINVKRVGFVSGDWEETYRRDMERASRLTGEGAPRGSGLPGDRGLRDERKQQEAANYSTPYANPVAEPVTSNWQGNAPSSAGVARPQRPQATAAPRFTDHRAQSGRPATAASRPTGVASSLAAVIQPSPRGYAVPPPDPATLPPSPMEHLYAGEKVIARGGAPAGNAPAGGGPYVGMSLTAKEIGGILARAGSGCPLGPCQGCAHKDVKTGACTA